MGLYSDSPDDEEEKKALLLQAEVEAEAEAEAAAAATAAGAGTTTTTTTATRSTKDPVTPAIPGQAPGLRTGILKFLEEHRGAAAAGTGALELESAEEASERARGARGGEKGPLQTGSFHAGSREDDSGYPPELLGWSKFGSSSSHRSSDSQDDSRKYDVFAGGVSRCDPSVHTHKHAYIQTCIHTYIQTYIHTYIHTIKYCAPFLSKSNPYPNPNPNPFFLIPPPSAPYPAAIAAVAVAMAGLMAATARVLGGFL
jgi:hypothetical protein